MWTQQALQSQMKTAEAEILEPGRGREDKRELKDKNAFHCHSTTSAPLKPLLCSSAQN